MTTIALLAACAQVTGLSDDYRYDLESDAGSVDAAGGDAAPDSAADAGGQCSATDQTKATTQITAASAASLPLACQQCLATSCCAPIDACATAGECNEAMRCVFACQRQNGGGGNSKAQCLDNCGAAFFSTLGACLGTRCGPPVCQLQ